MTPSADQFVWLPAWAWKFVGRHLSGRGSRPAVRWMNRFAFIGVVVGVFAWVSVVSVMNGLQGEIRDKILLEKPHLLWEGAPTRGLDAKVAALKATSGLELRSVKMLLQTEALMEIPSGRQKGRIAGAGVVLQGMNDAPSGAQIGSELAASLGLAPGDEIKLRSAWKLEGVPLVLRVANVFETGVPDIDRSGVRMSRAELESWLGLQDAVTRIEVQLVDPARADEVRPEVERVLGLPVKTWRETHASLWYSLKIEKIFMTIVVFFIVLLAALAVHLALSVRVAEKTREVGLLRALGADAALVRRIFLTEGALLGILGSGLGLVLSWIFCRLISGYVRAPDFYYSTSIPVDWNLATSLVMAAIAVGAATLASRGPAQRASRSTVVEALRA
ncbi:MAG: ABC transporter permease [Bdellovibrionales bacterium]|nr:ABC transporter permease [Bdellovibrionales bacterium]